MADGDIQATAADGSTHVFPKGTDPSVVDGVMKGYATGGAKPMPTSGASGSWDPAPKESLGAGLLKGVGEGLLQDTASVGRLINKIPMIGESIVPSQGLTAERKVATPTSDAQRLGAGAEQVAELFTPLGEEGLLPKIGAGMLKGGASTAMHEGGTTQGVNPTDVAINTVIGGAAPALEGAITGTVGSKVGRGFINESAGANARDVTYGNPAKALLDEKIANPFTGDIEKYKTAIRGGAAPQQAAQAAGGRIAAVTGKINEVRPQLDALLSKSTARISSKATVTDTIDNAIKSIKADHGVTQSDADAAITELNQIRQAVVKTAGGGRAIAWSPLQANAVKREIGNQVNWMGRERIGQLVEPVRKQIYGALNQEISKAAPGASQLNERLTNLLAAQHDLTGLSRSEEVGAGRGAAGGAVGRNIVGRLESTAGRVLPVVSKYVSKVPKLGAAAVTAGTSQRFGENPE